MLEQLDGWEVKLIEALDPAEWEEQIFAMAAEGYPLIYLKGDDLAGVMIDVADRFRARYPDVHVFLVDSYFEHDLDFVTAVAADPYEPSFVAGFVAAMTSETGEIAWIGHMDTVNLERFRMGYIAGAEYADPNINITVAFTGDFFDPVKGQEAVRNIMSQNPRIDVIHHAAYISGDGVISAADEMGIKVIGCDDWQGALGSTVFWNALKPVDLLVYSVANDWLAGREFGRRLSFNMTNGNKPYDDRDLFALPLELQQKVLDLCAGIADRSIDPYYGRFAAFRLDW
jgi:basic membrane protein A